MTTPTREQVVQLAKLAGLRTGGNGNYAVCNIGEVTALVNLSRADLEATIAEQAKEIRELKRLDFRGMREMLRAMQAGELTVSRGIEILDMWHAGNWNNDMLPPVRQDLIEEDSMPVEIIDQLRQQLLVSQAREAQLREALGRVRRECRDQDVIDAYFADEICHSALSTPPDDSALREYGAKLVEKIASEYVPSDLAMSDELFAVADKIREGTF